MDQTLVATAVLVLLGIAVADLAWLFARALWQRRSQRLELRFWHEHGKDLVVALGDPQAEAAWLARVSGASPALLRHVLDTYMTRVAGEFREGLARVYRRLGLLARDLRELRAWRRTTRLRALRRLATVCTREHRDAIAHLVDEGGEVRLLVAQIMGRIGTVDDVVGLLSTWRVKSRLGEYPVHVMVDALEPEALRAILPHWDRMAGVEVQRIVLGTAARVVPNACRELVVKAADHASLELRIAACHAAVGITTPETLALLVRLARDPAWEVRAQAMKALGAHRGDEADLALVEALADPSFWVRQNAATSLGAHGAVGLARLREVAARSGDRYARDAAEHVLAALDVGRAAPAGAAA